MLVCPNCGAEIRYIATGYNTKATCEAGTVEIITDKGHKFKGYLMHKCKGTKDDEQKDERNN